MKITRRPLGTTNVQELQSARNAAISPQEAAASQLVKYNAISDVAGAASRTIVALDEADKAADAAEDKVYAAAEQGYYESAIAEAKERHEKESRTNPEWTKELYEGEIDAIDRAYEDGFKNFKSESNRDAARKIHTANAGARKVQARGEAVVLQVNKTLAQYNKQYAGYEEAAMNAPVGQRGVHYEQLLTLLEIGGDDTDGQPLISPEKVAEEKARINNLIKDDYYSAQANDIFDVYISDEDAGDKMRTDLLESNIPAEDKAGIVSKLSAMMGTVDTVRAAQEEQDNFELDEYVFSQTSQWAIDPSTTPPLSDIAAWDLGDTPYALQKKKEAFAYARGIHSAKKSITDFGDGQWPDNEKARKAAEQKTRNLIKVMQSKAETEGVEWTPEDERIAYIAAASLVTRKHGVVPESAAYELEAARDIDSFIKTSPLAVALLDQGAFIDLHAKDFADDYENIHAIASTQERGTANIESIAESYHQKRRERDPILTEELQRQWAGRVGSNGQTYDSELQRAYKTVDDDFINEALGGIKGIDLLNDATRDRFFNELQAIGVGAIERAFMEELPETAIENAATLAIKNSGNIANGLNLDDDGDPIQEAYVGLPRITSTAHSKRDAAGVTETDHTGLRELLLDKELPTFMDSLGPDVKLRFQDGDNIKTLRLAEIEPTSLHLIPYKKRFEPTEYRLFVRDDDGLLNPTDMVIPTETGEVSHSVWLNTEVETAQAYTQAAKELDEAYEREVKAASSLKPTTRLGPALAPRQPTPEQKRRAAHATKERKSAEKKTGRFGL